MQNYSSSPKEMALSFWRNRNLIKSLTEREILGRYKGSMGGIVWAILHPLFMLLIYTFVFSIVFKAKWNSSSDSKTEFALILFSGLLVFNLFAECFNRSPNLILSNSNYVKKVIFPLEILPWVAIGAALFHMLIGLAVWFIAYLIFIGTPPWTILLTPLALMPLIFLLAGISWVFSSLGVYIRDIAQFTTVLTSIIMFISPIFYPIESIPEKYRIFLELNPITPSIEYFRDVLFFGYLPSISGWLINLLLSVLFSWFAFSCFQKARRGFADVI
jgi:lipopolysaccharide transport system permease protein